MGNDRLYIIIVVFIEEVVSYGVRGSLDVEVSDFGVYNFKFY